MTQREAARVRGGGDREAGTSVSALILAETSPAVNTDRRQR